MSTRNMLKWTAIAPCRRTLLSVYPCHAFSLAPHKHALPVPTRTKVSTPNSRTPLQPHQPSTHAGPKPRTQSPSSPKDSQFKWVVPVKTYRDWTDKDNQTILEAVANAAKEGRKPKWVELGSCLNRTSVAVYTHWSSVLNPALKKGAWTKEETEYLKAAVEEGGDNPPWKLIVQHLGRSANSVRDKWNLMNPLITKGAWTVDEDKSLLVAVKSALDKNQKPKWDDAGVFLKKKKKKIGDILVIGLNAHNQPH